MRATEALRQDHEWLQAQLTLLEEQLPAAQAAPATILHVISLIARGLHAHAAQEEPFFRTLQDALSGRAEAPARQRVAEHRAQRQALTALLDLLTRNPACQVGCIAAELAQLIGQLREYLASEDTTLFPLMDRFVPSAGPPQITEEMLVEHVVMAHPETKEIFGAFRVDCAADGGRCLKELSGLRGIDSDALLLTLNQSLGTHDDPVPIPRLLWHSCDGMMVIDGERRILAMNPALERLMGRRTQDVVGRNECGVLFACQDLHGCALSDHPEACPGLRAMHRARAVKLAEYSIQTAAGRRTWISASYTPIQPYSEGPRWALVVMRDLALQKRQERRMARQTMSDPLTGLVNRAGFLEACRKELSRTARHGWPAAVAMVDLDGFKAYNDTYGHLAGDELLRGLAQVLRTGLRTSEFIARYGGDEFVLLLPETDAAGAAAAATRLEQSVARFPFARPPVESPAHLTPITVSVGVAVFPGDGQTTGALLAQADRRLYEAKQRTHQRIVGPPQIGERRRAPRVELEAPILVRSLGEPTAAAHEGWVKNLSLAGAYLTVPPWKSIAIGEVLAVSITIPHERQQAFPFSRLAGPSRVVRLEELTRMSEPGQKRLGLSVAFGDDLTTLPSTSGNGRPHP